MGIRGEQDVKGVAANGAVRPKPGPQDTDCEREGLPKDL